MELVHLGLRGGDGLPLTDSIIASSDDKTIDFVVCIEISQVLALHLLGEVIFILSVNRDYVIVELIVSV